MIMFTQAKYQVLWITCAPSCYLTPTPQGDAALLSQLFGFCIIVIFYYNFLASQIIFFLKFLNFYPAKLVPFLVNH